MKLFEHVENPMVRLIKDVPTEGEHFCDTQCLKEYLGVKRVEGWELNER
ncbi:hypothetical protein PDQ75_25060 [Bacillus cereus group sp. Bc015]|nr:hypothetical protein [Bacillus cereus group sp. Bc015]MDA2738427.1 hypothetical protein [Bacillus cereus group sp. Bc015]